MSTTATPTQRFDKIQDQCGILQLLDISRPVAIDAIGGSLALNNSKCYKITVNNPTLLR
jgi:hypothetical protein